MGENPVDIAVGDFNNDGQLDLAITNIGCPFNGGACNDASVSILLGNGDGTFWASAPLTTKPLLPPFETKSGPYKVAHSIAIADFDGDGLLDLAVKLDPSSHIAIFFGHGDGTFTAGQNFQIGPGSGLFVGMVVGDFNQDGKPDLAVMYSENINSTETINGAVISLGNGDGTFQSPVEYPTPTDHSALSIVATDLNGDGKLDLVSLVSTFEVRPSPPGFQVTGVSISVFLGNGDGTFQHGFPVFSPLPPKEILGPAAAGDFNGDSRPDLAVVGPAGTGIAILLNLTAGSPVGSAQTTTALSASDSTVTVGASLALTAKVTPIASSALPTGTVAFSNGSTVLGTATVSSGVATYSTQSLAVGTYSIMATYNGDGTYAASTSPTISVAVVAFQIALSTSSLSVAAGQSGQATLTITPGPAFVKR